MKDLGRIQLHNLLVALNFCYFIDLGGKMQ